MTSITDYVKDPQKALIDAAADPSLRQYMEPSDIESVFIDYGDGLRAEAEALAGRSVRKFIDRITDKAAQAGVNLMEWICSSEEFNLCSKLDTAVGELMCQLDDFLKNKIAQGGIAAAGLITLFTAPALGAALTIFGALGFVNNAFVELCNCPVRV